VAEIIGTSRENVRQAIKRGKLSARMHGSGENRRLMVRSEEVHAWRESLKRPIYLENGGKLPDTFPEWVDGKEQAAPSIIETLSQEETAPESSGVFSSETRLEVASSQTAVELNPMDQILEAVMQLSQNEIKGHKKALLDALDTFTALIQTLDSEVESLKERVNSII
jgi:hypothetical protein